MAILLPICKLLKRKREKYNQWESREDTGVVGQLVRRKEKNAGPYSRGAPAAPSLSCSQFILSEVTGASAAFFTVYS